MTAVSQEAPGQTADRDGKSVSRTWATIAFVLSSVFTAALTVGGGYGTKMLEVKQEQRKTDYQRFQEVADKLDPLVRSFVRLYIRSAPVDGQGRPVQPIRLDDPSLLRQAAAIQANIQLQYTTLEQIELGLSPREATKVRQYRRELVLVSDELDSLRPVEEGKPLLQAIATARDTRVDVLAMLQGRAARAF